MMCDSDLAASQTEQKHSRSSLDVVTVFKNSNSFPDMYAWVHKCVHLHVRMKHVHSNLLSAGAIFLAGCPWLRPILIGAIAQPAAVGKMQQYGSI